MSTLRNLFVFAVAVALSGTLNSQSTGQQKDPPARKPGENTQKLTIDVAGADTSASADMLADAMNDAGLKVQGKLKPGAAIARTVVVAREDACLATAATKVNAVKTTNREQAPPGISLVLFAKLDEKSAAKAKEALGKHKGIDVAASKTDVPKGEIIAKLTGESKPAPAAKPNERAAPAGEHKLTANMILKSLKDAGITARTESSLQVTAVSE